MGIGFEIGVKGMEMTSQARSKRQSTITFFLDEQMSRPRSQSVSRLLRRNSRHFAADSLVRAWYSPAAAEPELILARDLDIEGTACVANLFLDAVLQTTLTSSDQPVQFLLAAATEEDDEDEEDDDLEDDDDDLDDDEEDESEGEDDEDEDEEEDDYEDLDEDDDDDEDDEDDE